MTFNTTRFVRGIYAMTSLFLLAAAAAAHSWIVAAFMFALSVGCCLMCELMVREPKRPSIREEIAQQTQGNVVSRERIARLLK